MCVLDTMSMDTTENGTPDVLYKTDEADYDHRIRK